MWRTIAGTFIALILAITAAGQGRSLDQIRRQAHELRSSNVTLSYDKDSDESKVMVVAPNFDDKDAAKAGVQAMNFAAAFNFSGTSLAAAPETVKFAFWVLTKKPRFAGDHKWIAAIGESTVDLGDARYAAKPNESIEYLNFVLSRADLLKISVTGARFNVGGYEFTVTAAQSKALTDLIALSSP